MVDSPWNVDSVIGCAVAESSLILFFSRSLQEQFRIKLLFNHIVKEIEFWIKHNQFKMSIAVAFIRQMQHRIKSDWEKLCCFCSRKKNILERLIWLLNPTYIVHILQWICLNWIYMHYHWKRVRFSFIHLFSEQIALDSFWIITFNGFNEKKKKKHIQQPKALRKRAIGQNKKLTSSMEQQKNGPKINWL